VTIPASFPLHMVTRGVKGLWKRICFLLYKGTKISVNFGDRPFEAKLSKICKVRIFFQKCDSLFFKKYNFII
jgi:hypothetical protein